MRKRNQASEPGVRISLCLPAESCRQLEELAKTLNVSRTSVISLAIGRWYHEEPLIQSRTPSASSSSSTAASAATKKKKKKRRTQVQTPFASGEGPWR